MLDVTENVRCLLVGTQVPYCTNSYLSSNDVEELSCIVNLKIWVTKVVVSYFKHKYLGNSNKGTEYNHEKSRSELPVSWWILELGIYRKSQYNYKKDDASFFAFDIMSRTLKLKQYHIFRSAIRSILLKIFKQETLCTCANCDFPAGYVPSLSSNHHLASHNFSGASSGIWRNHFVKYVWLFCIQNNVG
jgi:hypothetical protein